MERTARSFVIASATIIAVEATLAFAANDSQWVAPTFLFWTVVVAASLCFVAAMGLMFVANRNEQPELGFVALFFVSAALLPLVHGLTTPGVLYGANSATSASVFLAIPVGLLAMSPSLLRSMAFGRSVARHWRPWAAAWILAILALSATMLVSPNLVPVPEMGSPIAIVVAIASLTVTVVAAWRHVRLARIAERNGPLVVAFGYVLVGSSALVFLSGPAYTPHFWLAHLLDISGVFLATIGGIFVYFRSSNAKRVLAPVVALDPHAALEVGLSPIVHEFILSLETKDQITRDHVIRCGSLAIELATFLRLSPEQVREAGLVGLLHDVGKLRIPDAILTKPGKLTDDEFEVVKTHTTIGSDLLERARGLEGLAPIVRGHHERMDGRGYPDRLAGARIPLVSRLVAVCDAFDAMTMTRQYRQGMPIEKVHSILREHAGSQWDATMVDAIISYTSSADFVHSEKAPLDLVGRGDEHDRVGCGCVPVLAEAR